MPHATPPPGQPSTHGDAPPAAGAAGPPPAGTTLEAGAAAGPARVPGVGRPFGRYDLLAEIARGGMGVVFKAWDRQVGRPVAVKMIRAGAFAQPVEVERFFREAEAVARLSHPHIVPLYDFGRIDGYPYFVMQLASGGSLDKRLTGPLPAAQAAALVEKVARAVEYAHRRRILHRDLKPANILLGEGDEPLVADFGLAKSLDADQDGLTRTGVTPGTPAYMAPEQAAGRTQDVGPRTDVWALGAILYELLTGRRCFSGQNREEVLHRILTTAPPAPHTAAPDLDAGLEAVVLRCLEKDAARRYASADELADALGRWQRGELATLSAPVAPRPAAARPRRAAALLLVAATLAALALGAGLAAPKSERPAPPASPPVILLGGDGPPGTVRWALWQGDEPPPAPTREGLSVRTGRTALAELLAAAPWESYRLEAEIRQDRAQGGTAGVYLGYAGYPSTEGPCHVLINVGFAERGWQAGRLDVGVWRLPDDDPAHHFSAHWHRAFHFDAAPAAPAPWRALAVEVTPKEVRIYFDGAAAGAVTAAEIGLQADALFADAQGLAWETVPRGGIGVYIDEDGEAAFRNVQVRPLTAPR